MTATKATMTSIMFITPIAAITCMTGIMFLAPIRRATIMASTMTIAPIAFSKGNRAKHGHNQQCYSAHFFLHKNNLLIVI